MNESKFRDRQKREQPVPVDPAGRVPPHNLDAEAAVLSAILLAPEVFDSVQEILQPEHCYSEANRRILEGIFALSQTNRPIDMVTVASWLQERQLLQAVGGTAYIAALAESTPSVANVEAHARTVKERWRLRQLIATCQKFASEGYGDCGDVQGFVDQAEQAIFTLARSPEGSSIRVLREALQGAFDVITSAATRGDGIIGVPSGFHDLDRKTSGLHPSDLYIVAGRPGMGKTSFVLNLAANIARPTMVAGTDERGNEVSTEEPGWAAAFFSLEMPREQLAARLLACEAQVDMSKIRSGRLASEDWNKMTDAAARLGRMPIWLDDTPAITLLDVRAKVRRLKAELSRGSSEGVRARGLGLVAIDYLQLMQGRAGVQSREQEISELSRGLKQLAKELKVPVMALSQLNRSVETRNAKDKRPQLSDLRESGAIEQDADCIMFIYRDEYYFEDSPDKGRAEVIIAKQRNGPTGKVMTKFTSAYTRFDNLEEDELDRYDDFEGFQQGMGP